MSTMNLSFATFNRTPSLHWGHLGHYWDEFRRCYAEWRSRAVARRELLMLSDYELQDIGLSRVEAVREGSKPFWQV